MGSLLVAAVVVIFAIIIQVKFATTEEWADIKHIPDQIRRLIQRWP